MRKMKRTLLIALMLLLTVSLYANVLKMPEVSAIDVFGRNVEGTGYRGFGSKICGSKYYLTAHATIRNMTAYVCNVGSASCKWKMAIYDESWKYKGATVEGTISPFSDFEWRTLEAEEPFDLFVGYYWLCVWGEGGGDKGPVIAFETGGTGAYKSIAYTGTFPGQLSGMNSNSEDYCIFSDCVYYPKRTWTFMYYGDHDAAWICDWEGRREEMGSVGSTSEVNIIGQFDPSTFGGDPPPLPPWPPSPLTLRYYFHPSQFEVLWYAWETNMSDPQTLVDFVTWSVDNFPADRYALVLYNHGGGFQYLCEDEMPEEDVWVPVIYPDSGQYMDMIELKSALDQIKSHLGKPLDYIAFDMCYMGELEVCYQIRSCANVFVGSEEFGRPRGYPYDWLLGNLTASPTMDEYELAETTVDVFRDYYSLPGSTGNSSTISAVNLSCVGQVAQQVGALANALLQDLDSYRQAINDARDEVTEFGAYHFIDNYNFADLLKGKVNNKHQVRTICDSIKSAISQAVLYEWHNSNHPGAAGIYGLSVYFPEQADDYDNRYDTHVDMSTTYNWDTFLKQYLNITS